MQIQLPGTHGYPTDHDNDAEKASVMANVAVLINLAKKQGRKEDKESTLLTAINMMAEAFSPELYQNIQDLLNPQPQQPPININNVYGTVTGDVPNMLPPSPNPQNDNNLPNNNPPNQIQ